MKQIKFLIVVSNTSRSLIYLQNMKKNKLQPKEIIYLDNRKKNNIRKILRKNFDIFFDVKIKKFNCTKINKKVSNYILSKKEKYVVYCGYPGIIVKNSIINKKEFLHSHPGRLPNYKGSNTIYYSILKEKIIYCTTFILNSRIDEGSILFEKKYRIPKNIITIDSQYDSEIRAKNLVYVLKNLHSIKKRKQYKNNKIPYFVMHPILRIKVFMKQKLLNEKTYHF